MKDKSFAKAMNQIAALDEARRREDQARMARMARRDKINRYIAASLWVAMFAVAFYYHTELQDFLNKNVLAGPKVRMPGMAAIGSINGTNGVNGTNGTVRSTGENLKFITEQAAKREEVLDMTMTPDKKPAPSVAPKR